MNYLDAVDEKLMQNQVIKGYLSMFHTMVPNAKPVKAVHILAGAGLFLVSFIWLFCGVRALATCVGFLYPMWATFHALGTPGGEDDKEWLTYWLVYGFVNFVEQITDVFLFWIPFYE